jgi:hypothetical protein
MIKSIVEVARLSDPRSAQYRAGGVTVCFDHAAARHGLADNTAKYIVNFASLGNMTVIVSTSAKPRF